MCNFFLCFIAASRNNISHVLLIIRFHATSFPKIPKHEANVSIITSYQLAIRIKIYGERICGGVSCGNATVNILKSNFSLSDQSKRLSFTLLQITSCNKMTFFIGSGDIIFER